MASFASRHLTTTMPGSVHKTLSATLFNYNWFTRFHYPHIAQAVLSVKYLAEHNNAPELIAVMYAMTQAKGATGEKKGPSAAQDLAKAGW